MPIASCARRNSSQARPTQHLALALRTACAQVAWSLGAVVVPRLLDDAGGVDRHVALVGLLVSRRGGAWRSWRSPYRVGGSPDVSAGAAQRGCVVARKAAVGAIFVASNRRFRQQMTRIASPRPHRPAPAGAPAAGRPRHQRRAGRAGEPVALGLPAPGAAAGARRRDRRLRAPRSIPSASAWACRPSCACSWRSTTPTRSAASSTRVDALGRSGRLPRADRRHGLPAARRGAGPGPLLALPARPPAQRQPAWPTSIPASCCAR